MSDTILKALLELRRDNMIIAKLNPQTANRVDDSLVFAFCFRLCPIFHVPVDDPFSDAWKIPRSLVENVFEVCKNLRHEQRPSIDAIEGRFGRELRLSLVPILRYLFLNGQFDDAFWTPLLTISVPSEYHGVRNPLNESELLRQHA